MRLRRSQVGHGTQVATASRVQLGATHMKTYTDRAERRAVSLRGYALNESRDSDILLADLSYTGCQIRCADALKAGEFVELRVMKRGAVQAEIRWADKDRAGAQFLN
jgi:hypothetical protein